MELIVNIDIDKMGEYNEKMLAVQSAHTDLASKPIGVGVLKLFRKCTRNIKRKATKTGMTISEYLPSTFGGRYGYISSAQLYLFCGGFGYRKTFDQRTRYLDDCTSRPLSMLKEMFTTSVDITEHILKKFKRKRWYPLIDAFHDFFERISDSNIIVPERAMRETDIHFSTPIELVRNEISWSLLDHNVDYTIRGIELTNNGVVHLSVARQDIPDEKGVRSIRSYSTEFEKAVLINPAFDVISSIALERIAQLKQIRKNIDLELQKLESDLSPILVPLKL